MATLRDVMVTLFGDVVRAKVAADEATSDAVRLYRTDPILRQLQVPKLSIQSIDLTVPFAIATATERPPQPFADLPNTLRDLVSSAFPKFASLSLRARPRARSVTLSTILGEEAETFQKALAAEAEKFAHEHATLFMEDRDRFTKDLAARLTTRIETDSRAVLIPAAGRELAQLSNDITNSAAAKSRQATPALDLEVKVTAQDLAEVPDPSLSKITLTLSLTDLDVISRGDGDETILSPH